MSDWRPSSLGVYPAGQMPPSPAPSPRQWQPLLVKVPEITVYFWVIKLLTTALGESTSDFLVYQINPYVAVGLGCFGLVAALILQLSLRRYIAWVYWLAALMVAVFGTMAADVLHVVLGISYVVSTTFFSAALAVVFVVWYLCEHTLSIHSVYRGRRELFYWAAVIATFALGTAAGDLTAATLNLGYFPSILLFAVLFALPALGYWLLRFNAIAAFWWAYIVTRPLGASIADWLGKPYLGGLGLGDGKVSLVLLILLVLFVVYLSVTHRDVQGRSAERR
ncbi:membrane protein [Thermogemmatispora aurantia]|jgi:uncharacterized membrane-anchored protein|nr:MULTISPECIES: hypothetical protein [Thermogemmatispora]GER84301.1 membrane protein [Thermogemmatispora aurantia]